MALSFTIDSRLGTRYSECIGALRTTRACRLVKQINQQSFHHRHQLHLHNIQAHQSFRAGRHVAVCHSHGATGPSEPGSNVMQHASHEDVRYMNMALDMAQQAFDQGEVPVGAVIVQGGQVLAAAYNQTHKTHNPIAHAEVMCIMEAARQLQAWRLLDATMYVTVEPCPMVSKWVWRIICACMAVWHTCTSACRLHDSCVTMSFQVC